MILDRVKVFENQLLKDCSERDIKEIADGISIGIFAGIFAGFLVGISAGIFAGISAGISIGIFAGIFVGFLVGISVGIFAGISAGILTIAFNSLFFIAGFAFLSDPPLLIVAIAILLLGELFFWLDKKQPEKEKRFWFTAKRKALALAESAFVVLEGLGLIEAIERASSFIGLNQKTVLEWLGYFGVIVIGIAIVCGYIWLNSLKYNGGKGGETNGIERKERASKKTAVRSSH